LTGSLIKSRGIDSSILWERNILSLGGVNVFTVINQGG
jgi:hypothetical protein